MLPASNTALRRILLATTLLALLPGCQGVMASGQNSEGARFYQQGNFPAAMQRFQQAAYTNPNDANAYYNLAATYHELGRVQGRPEYLKQAENYYHQCLDRQRDHVDCHRALAVLLVEQERSPEAFRFLEQWVATSPTTSEARVELARLYEDFSDRETARQHLQAALSFDPRNSRALAALGRLHEESGNAPQALADYERSLEYNRFQPELARRAASLRASVAPPSMNFSPAPLNETRTVAQPTPGFRY
jgi:tetratricopeptide (TPR) repeat protein